MENHHFIAGKINYFDWAIFNSYVSHNQRLNLHFPMVFLWVFPFSYGFPMVFPFSYGFPLNLRDPTPLAVAIGCAQDHSIAMKSAWTLSPGNSPWCTTSTECPVDARRRDISQLAMDQYL